VGNDHSMANAYGRSAPYSRNRDAREPCVRTRAVSQGAQRDGVSLEIIKRGFLQLFKMGSVIMSGQDKTPVHVVEDCDSAYVLADIPEV
jgi:hypothetical protein